MTTPRLCLAMMLAFVMAVGARGEEPRPKIGLALSGGGAKGFAHIGVLRALEELHVPVDYIAGTSMGAVVGAFYSSGMTPDEIEEGFLAVDWSEVLNDATPYRRLAFRRKEDVARYPSTTEFGIVNGRVRGSRGIRTGQRLTFLLARYLLPHLDQKDFSRLPVPFAAVATDLETGEPVVLDRGDIVESIRASMSIPAFFTPVELGDRLLVDGGVSMNIPVDVVRQMGADVVIAIDIGQPLSDREELRTTVAVVDQLTNMLTRSNMAPQLEKADLVLSPDIRDVSTFDFQRISEIVPLGYATAEASRADLERWALSSGDYAAWNESRKVPRAREVIIDEIRVEGLEVVNDGYVLRRLRTVIGKPLDLDVLQRDIDWLYGSDDFVGVHFGLATTEGRTALVIRVEEKPWGPSYLRAGLSLSADTVSSVNARLLFSHDRRWLNDRGAEWRTDLAIGRQSSFRTELYQPREFDRPGFLRLGAAFERERIELYEGEDAVAEYLVSEVGVQAEAGLVIP